MEETFYLLYSLDVVHFYTNQKVKFDIDKSRKYKQKARITTTVIRWESKTLLHHKPENTSSLKVGQI